MANITKQFAELLGVKLEEEFELTRVSDGKPLNKLYRITENEGLMVYSECVKNWMQCDGEKELLLGSYEIIKQPYKPRKGEKYWALDGFNKLTAGRYKWGDTLYDYIRLKSGLVFRTETEAIEARPRVYRELTGKEWAEYVTEN